MEHPNTPVRYTTHPVLLIAAIAVVLFCTVGLAALLGWLPSSNGSSTPSGQALSAVPAGQYSNAPMGPPVADTQTQIALQKAAQPAPPRYDTSGTTYGQSTGSGYAEEERVAQAAPAVCHSCGVVESVTGVRHRAQGSGLGAGAGAVVGGLLGNQIGGGTGRTLATAAGAVGGAVLGNQVEGNMKAYTSYDVRVRMDDGKYRTFHTSAASFQAGEHVKVVKGVLHHR